MADTRTQQRFVTITVSIRDGAIDVSPDVVSVVVGTVVIWAIQATEPLGPIEATIYFGRRSPFQEKSLKGVFETSHVIQEATEHTGDFKYGVKAEQVSSRKTLGDVDPWIRVHREELSFHVDNPARFGLERRPAAEY
jgi:hypothetical protein